MTLTPTDHARIVALAETTWAEVPEARPKHDGAELGWDGVWFSQYEGHTQDDDIVHSVALALIESACVRWLKDVRIYSPTDENPHWSVHCDFGNDHPLEMNAPTLVEALLMAVRAIKKKEPTRE